MTRKNVYMSLAGSGLLLLGLLAGIVIGGHFTAQAAPRQAGAVAITGTGAVKYCQIYEGALATELGVSATTLEQDNQTAIGKALDAMVADKQITATEETQLKGLLAKLGTAPCNNLDGKTGMKAVMSYLQSDTLVAGTLLTARVTLAGAVATPLHLTSDQLQKDLSNGQSIGALIKAQSASASAVQSAYLQAAQGLLSQAVTNGVITQDQSNAVYKALQGAVNAGHYPLLDAMGSMGSMGGLLGGS